MDEGCFVVSNTALLPLQRNRSRHSSNRCWRITPVNVASSSNTTNTATITPEPWDINLKSPSKINLFLRILGKRKDGYHELASLFQAISFHDNLSVSLQPQSVLTDKLECSTPGVPTDSTNLVMQAFENFRQSTGSTRHFRARLEKRVPHAAGLGGGSANAATALWAANKLTNSKCSDNDLAEIGAKFGSDISFFFTNGSAYCTGRGDKLMEIERLNPNVLHIIKPAESLNTRKVFNMLDVEKCKEGRNPSELLDKMKKGVIFADFVNDLEEPSFKLVPRLKVIKQALYKAGFNVVMMTGSGTSFFCLGHPLDPDYFYDVFPTEYNVKVEQCMFASRRFPGMWYFEQPPLSELADKEYGKLLM